MWMRQHQVERFFDRQTPGLRISLSEFLYRLKKVTDEYNWFVEPGGMLRARPKCGGPRCCPLQVVFGFGDEMQALSLYRPIAIAADADDDDYDDDFAGSNISELRKTLLKAVGLEELC